MSVIRDMWVSRIQSLYLIYGKLGLRQGRDLPKATPEVGTLAKPADLRSKVRLSAFLGLHPLFALVPYFCLLASEDWL